VTNHGPEKRERGAQLLHALCRATDPQEQDRIAKELDDLLLEGADGRHLNRDVQPEEGKIVAQPLNAKRIRATTRRALAHVVQHQG